MFFPLHVYRLHVFCFCSFLFIVILRSNAVTSVGSSEEYSACVPISITMARTADRFTIYCRTVAKGRFECLAKRSECVLTVSPRKQFVPQAGEDVCGVDELSISASRVVKIPDNLLIDVHSKEISYNSNSGIITIRFACQDK